MIPSKIVWSVEEVASLFGVDRKTITRWCREERLPYFKTPGGRYRFYASEIEPMREVKA